MNAKRIVGLATLALVLAVPMLIVVAPSVSAEVTQTRTPINFTLTPACPNLKVTVQGSGESFLVINHRIDQNGVDHIERNDLVTGTAIDSDGATYLFNYHNHARIDIPTSGFPFQVTTTDHFNLNGEGRANQIHVGFVLRLTFTSPSDPPIVEFVNVRGNPMFCDAI
jgi:hypothetical protein